MKVETLGRNADSSEEFWYQFDTAGRLNYAAFGLIPLEGEDDYSAELAAYRLISKYEYEPAGRIASVATISQEGEVGLLSGHVESYSKIYDIAANSNEYDAYLGLKTESQTMWWGTSGAYSQGRRQYYAYDSLDQLSHCDFYNLSSSDVESSHTTSYWYYDAAGNRYTNSDRDDHTYTNLNMMTDSPGSLDYDNDVLGNRTWREPETASAVKYVWDSVNRLVSARGHSNGAAYKYRADGMRVKKVTGYTIEWHPPEGEAGGYYDEDEDENAPTFRYFYDGQMCMEDDYLDQELEYEGRRYGLGARGVDFIQTFDEYGAQTGRIFPVYDGHGNMICTVSRNGTSGYYAPTDVRDMGPWGEPRITSNSSLLPPDSGYCANLGQKEDFESGMVYMRARYYEPATGRFISEDPAMEGDNWYAYCASSPVNGADFTGKRFGKITLNILVWLAGIVAHFSGPEGPYGKCAKDLVERVAIVLGGLDLASYVSNAAILLGPEGAGYACIANACIYGATGVVLLAAAASMTILLVLATDGDMGPWATMYVDDLAGTAKLKD